MNALDGVRILDFGWAFAAPYGTLLLAYCGAEVIKVESMRRIDLVRKVAFFYGRAKSEKLNLEMSSDFNELNANKLGIRLNLSHPKAIEIAKQLVKVSDAIVENFRPGVMESWGLGYSALKEIKPDIIMMSVSSHGATGPEADYIGYADNFCALGGLSYVTGYSDGEPALLHGPSDLVVGLTSAYALLAALNFRQRTGEGQYIDLSATESIACLVGEILMDYIMNARVQGRKGNRDDTMAPHNCYACQGEDKWISIAVSSEDEWKALCAAMGNPGWVEDDRFSDAYSRWQHQEQLDKLIEGWTKAHTNYEVMETLQKFGVGAVPSFSNEELFHDPHCKQREVFLPVEHPELGRQFVIGPPWKLSATPAEVTRQAPLFGEHNQYVLGELLGLSDKEITCLAQEGVLD